MKTKVYPAKVCSANKPDTKQNPSLFAIFFIILLTLFQFSFNNNSSAQQENRWEDSISAQKRECVTREAREVEEWSANYGLSINTTVTGSGNGIYYCPSFFMHSKFGFISIGAAFQKQKMNFSGYQVQYEYNLLDPSLIDSCNFERLELIAFLNTTYQFNAILSAAAQKEENFLNTNPTPAYLKTLEAYAGIGMRIKVLENLKMFGCIGFGGYKIMTPPTKLFHDKQGIGLLLRFGISYEFDKNAKMSKR